MVTKSTPEPPSPGVEPGPSYVAAMESASVLRRRERRFLSVDGVNPPAMLKGVLSGRLPPPLVAQGRGWDQGDAPYSTVLTPKGKMVTDLRLIPGQGAGFLLDLPEAGLAGVSAHFKKFLNPRFAHFEDRSGDYAMLTVLGPEGPARVSEVLGFDVVNPGPGRVHFRHGGSSPELWLLGNADVDAPALDIVLSSQVVEVVRGRMEEIGIRSMERSTWDVLRIEAGTPTFGADMTEDTIPVEAGIHHRAIDYQKGCYTGQEVIIRLRDRGRVNKRLCRILLGGAEVPSTGADLFLPETVSRAPGSVDGAATGGRKVGWITSACRSPRYGQTIALGFVKRGVEPGGVVMVGWPDGSSGQVAAID